MAHLLVPFMDLLNLLVSPINTVQLANAGIGYSNGTFSNVPLFAITGNGSGAQASVTVSSNVIKSVSV